MKARCKVTTLRRTAELAEQSARRRRAGRRGARARAARVRADLILAIVREAFAATLGEVGVHLEFVRVRLPPISPRTHAAFAISGSVDGPGMPTLLGLK